MRACLLSCLRSILIWPMAVMGYLGGGSGGDGGEVYFFPPAFPSQCTKVQ